LLVHEGKGREKVHGRPPQAIIDRGDEELAPEVVTLTDGNFDSIVTSADSDVMLEFYAPWCGHCKQLKPEYSSLAKHYEGDTGVTIAAMDATVHSPPSEFKIEGYPTLIYYTKDKKQIPYDGPREKSDMVEWIEKTRTT